jgi:hypothetical protein
LFTAAFLASTVSSVIGTSTQAAATVAASTIAATADKGGDDGRSLMNGTIDYYIDTLYRADQPMAADADVHGETTRIVINGLKDEEGFSAEDKAYLSRVVARRAGISESEATTRVDRFVAQLETLKTKATEAAESARKTAASVSIFTFLSLLIGAFIASVAAAVGGRQRDFA